MKTSTGYSKAALEIQSQQAERRAVFDGAKAQIHLFMKEYGSHGTPCLIAEVYGAAMRHPGATGTIAQLAFDDILEEGLMIYRFGEGVYLI